MKQDKNKARGFASMSKERRAEISSLGGKAAHAYGTAHKFNSETGKNAGKIGGKKLSENREHMREIGRKGGKVTDKEMHRRIVYGKQF